MRRPRRRYEARLGVQVVEMLVFLAASALGIFALGSGLSGLFEPGRSIRLAWLAVLAVTLWILFSQMGRVRDAWPRRSRPEATKAAKPAIPDSATLLGLWRRLIRDEGDS